MKLRLIALLSLCSISGGLYAANKGLRIPTDRSEGAFMLMQLLSKNPNNAEAAIAFADVVIERNDNLQFVAEAEQIKTTLEKGQPVPPLPSEPNDQKEN